MQLPIQRECEQGSYLTGTMSCGIVHVAPVEGIKVVSMVEATCSAIRIVAPHMCNTRLQFIPSSFIRPQHTDGTTCPFFTVHSIVLRVRPVHLSNMRRRFAISRTPNRCENYGKVHIHALERRCS